MQSEKWNVNLNGRSFPQSAPLNPRVHIVRLQYKHKTEPQKNISVVSMFVFHSNVSLQVCQVAKWPSSAVCRWGVLPVWSLVAAWRPFLVTTPSELRQCSASCPRTSTNAGHPRSGTVTVTTLASGHSGHVATGPLSRTSERLAAGVERVRRHDSGSILM